MPTKKLPTPKPPSATAGDSAPGQHQPVDALVHKEIGRAHV